MGPGGGPGRWETRGGGPGRWDPGRWGARGGGAGRAGPGSRRARRGHVQPRALPRLGPAVTFRGGGARRPPIGRCWRRGAVAAQWARGAQVSARLSARGAQRGASPRPPDTRPGRRVELPVPHPLPAGSRVERVACSAPGRAAGGGSFSRDSQSVVSPLCPGSAFAALQPGLRRCTPRERAGKRGIFLFPANFGTCCR